MALKGKDQLFQKTTRPGLIRVNYYLPKDQTAYLDELCFRIRQISGVRITMSEVIRTLIDGAREKKIDPATIESSEDLKTAIFG